MTWYVIVLEVVGYLFVGYVVTLLSFIALEWITPSNIKSDDISWNLVSSVEHDKLILTIYVLLWPLALMYELGLLIIYLGWRLLKRLDPIHFLFYKPFKIIDDWHNGRCTEDTDDVTDITDLPETEDEHTT